MYTKKPFSVIVYSLFLTLHLNAAACFKCHCGSNDNNKTRTKPLPPGNGAKGFIRG